MLEINKENIKQVKNIIILIIKVEQVYTLLLNICTVNLRAVLKSYHYVHAGMAKASDVLAKECFPKKKKNKKANVRFAQKIGSFLNLTYCNDGTLSITFDSTLALE
jgi:hypothetical protein